ncbi:hypothetical protein, partial [Methylobacterium sp. WSM2598]|uniref:hypothetical protein n=1 Tax=Methylobacterium sp. WSM2598 TaxID=398261 RepID=UPI001AEC5C0C
GYRVAGFISERWPTSNRNAGRLRLGTGGRLQSESALGWLGAALREPGKSAPTQQQLNAGLAAIGGLAPRNEAEAMLAVQMLATNEAALSMLGRARAAVDPVAMERYGTLATKLQRTFLAQLEAFAKLRRGGEQKVTVEHVHVHQGGQAIVGAVSAPAGGGTLENQHQPHARAGPATLALSDGAPVLRSDEAGMGLPRARGEREDALPDARRGVRKRRAQR